MTNPLLEVKSVRERAESHERAGRWKEAADAYDALGKAWLKASGLAVTQAERQRRIALAEEARSKAGSLRAKPEKAPATTGGSDGSGRNNGTQNESIGNESSDEAPETSESLESLLEQLDALVGLEAVKRQVRLNMELLEFHRKRAENGLANPEMSHHLVFTGNPGTGKTTVARLIAKLYRAMGLLKKGQLVETDREGLIAEHIGGTAVKTKAVIERALGGVLFIDEAYELGKKGQSGNDFGSEAIATLLKAMEDHRDNLVVIVAGYPDLMDYLIHKTNPGLPSRFRTTIHFENYSADDLTLIFQRLAENVGDEPTKECLDAVRKHYRKVLASPPPDFANARDVRNLYDKAHENVAHRIAQVANPTVEQLKTLTVEDVRNAF